MPTTDIIQLKITADAKQLREEKNKIKKDLNEIHEGFKGLEYGSQEYADQMAKLVQKTNEFTEVASFKDLRSEYNKLRREVEGLVPGTEEYIRKSKQLDIVRDKFKEVGGEIRGANKSTEAIGEAFQDQVPILGKVNELLSKFGLEQINIANNQGGVKGTLKAMGSGLWGLVRAGAAFIATPIGATIAVLAGIALATKSWFNFNNEITKTNIELENITGLSGDAVNEVRIRAESLQKVFDKDIKDTTNSAKKLVTQFGVSYEEAFDIIEEGLINGGAANEEFLESIDEFGVFFDRAGFSANEFKNIVNSGFDLGIYKDKLPDAIKEFDLAIKEQTQATKDALVGAFGKGFTDELLAKVEKGEITTKEALQSIAEETEKVGVNAKDSATLTADLFKGAGEDAGGYQKIIEAVNNGLNEQQREYNELEQYQKDQIESVKKLKKAQDDAFRSEGFIKFKTIFITTWNDIKTFFYNTITDIRIDFQWLTKSIEPITDIFTKYKVDSRFKQFFGLLKKGFSDFVNPIKKVRQLSASISGLIAVFRNLNNDTITTVTNIKKAFANFDFSSPIKSAKNLSKVVLSEFKTLGTEAGNVYTDAYKKVMENPTDVIIPEETSPTKTKDDRGGGDDDKTLNNTAEKLAELSKLREENIQKILATAKTEEEIENQRFNKAIESIGALGKAREELTAEQLKALEILEKEHSDNLTQIETDRLRANRAQKIDSIAQEMDDLKVKFVNKEISYEEYIGQIEVLEKEHTKYLLDEEKSLLDELKVLRGEDDEYYLQRLAEHKEREFNIKFDWEEKRAQDEQERLEKEVEAREEAEKKKQEAIEKTKKEHTKNTKQTLSTISGFVGDIMALDDDITKAKIKNAEGNEAEQERIRKKAFERNKLWALAQLAINTALGIVNIWGTMIDPTPIQAFKIAATAVLAATSVAQGIAIATKKYARGGLFEGVPNGPLHKDGGISIISKGVKIGELEGGEPILSRKTYAQNKALIDMLLYNGKHRNGASIFEDGGVFDAPDVSIVQQQYNSTATASPQAINYEALGLAVAGALKETPIEATYDPDKLAEVQERNAIIRGE